MIVTEAGVHPKVSGVVYARKIKNDGRRDPLLWASPARILRQLTVRP
jgi:hypothetical protein